jgi:NAD(P)H-dependent FMN reductase
MKFLVFLGSVRTTTPPEPARLGERVARACVSYIEQTLDGVEVELIDPLDYDLGPVFKPHFAYHQKDMPKKLQALADKIEEADGYVMVSPEYNHSMGPALANLLNHFGASLYSYKPSAIATYSAGQWGGARAAVALRSFLGELGCLPVSAMIHVPKAQDVLNEKGEFVDTARDSDAWAGYFGRTLNQLWWWAQATQKQRRASDPRKLAKDFKRDPSQRNAPGADDE